MAKLMGIHAAEWNERDREILFEGNIQAIQNYQH